MKPDHSFLVFQWQLSLSFYWAHAALTKAPVVTHLIRPSSAGPSTLPVSPKAHYVAYKKMISGASKKHLLFYIKLCKTLWEMLKKEFVVVFLIAFWLLTKQYVWGKDQVCKYLYFIEARMTLTPNLLLMFSVKQKIIWASKP